MAQALQSHGTLESEIRQNTFVALKNTSAICCVLPHAKFDRLLEAGYTLGICLMLNVRDAFKVKGH